VAASRNYALRQATGSYITFLDQDDIWLPNKLKIQLAAFDKHPELGLIHSDLARIDQEGALLPQFQRLDESHFDNPHASVQIGYVFNQIFISNDIQPLTSMIPRGVFDEVGQFNEGLPGVDDYELWLRIAKLYPIGQIQTILGYWRKHETQQSTQGYKMLILRLMAIDTIFASDPDAAKLINRKDYIRRMHALNRGVANHYLYNVRDYRQARLHFFRAVRLKPLDINSLVKWSYCCLPEGMRKPLRWIKDGMNIGLR
jgi:glycosyltransferase involved in cell wall biosynthesis